MDLGTKYKERCSWRFVETLIGAFWSLVLPVAAVLISVYADFPAYGATEIGCIIFAYITIFILEIAAFKFFLAGLNDFYFHKKVGLIIYEDCLEIAVRGKLFKKSFRRVNFEDITEFCASFDGIVDDLYAHSQAETSPYKAKSKMSGRICFGIINEKGYNEVSIFNCIAAAEFIMGKLDIEQIDTESNELKKY